MDSTGLYYYGARFYDPTLGRFINLDPAKDGLNWYVYVNNNPLRYVDPDGLSPGGFVPEWDKEPVSFNLVEGLMNIFKSIFSKDSVKEAMEPGKLVDWNPVLIPFRGDNFDLYLGELKVELDVPIVRTFQAGCYDKALFGFNTQANIIKIRGRIDTPVLKLDTSLQYGIGDRFALTKPYFGLGYSIEIEPNLIIPKNIIISYMTSTVYEI